MGPAAIKAGLAKVATALAEVNTTRRRLYRRRLKLLQAGRALQPPITQRELASSAGMHEEAATQVLRKAALVDAHQAGDHPRGGVPKCPECKKATAGAGK